MQLLRQPLCDPSPCLWRAVGWSRRDKPPDQPGRWQTYRSVMLHFIWPDGHMTG